MELDNDIETTSSFLPFVMVTEEVAVIDKSTVATKVEAKQHMDAKLSRTSTRPLRS